MPLKMYVYPLGTYSTSRDCASTSTPGPANIAAWSEKCNLNQEPINSKNTTCPYARGIIAFGNICFALPTFSFYFISKQPSIPLWARARNVCSGKLIFLPTSARRSRRSTANAHFSILQALFAFSCAPATWYHHGWNYLLGRCEGAQWSCARHAATALLPHGRMLRGSPENTPVALENMKASAKSRRQLQWIIATI